MKSRNKIHIVEPSVETVIGVGKERTTEISLPFQARISPLPSKISENYEGLFILFLQTSYYMGIVPFYPKIKESDSGRRIETSSSNIHLVIVAIVHICAALRFLMRFSLLSYDLKQPINYFIFARTALSAVLCSFFIWSLWIRHKVVITVLNRLANFNNFPNVTTLSKNYARYLLLTVTICFLCITSVNRALDECRTRTESLCGKNEYGQRYFCNDQEHYEGKVIFQILFIVFNYFGRTTRRLPRVELLVIGCTLWQLCKSFKKHLQQQNQQHDIEKKSYSSSEIFTILSAFEQLKEISNLICEVIGEMLISEIVEDIVYFSLEVQLRLRDAEWFNIFVIMESWLVAILAYFVSACAAGHIEELSVWLSRDDIINQLSPGKIMTLRMQLLSDPVGLKGGSLFTVTKRFLSNVVTVWVTYFIILLQFQTSM